MDSTSTKTNLTTEEKERILSRFSLSDIIQFCTQENIIELSVFGSVLRDDFREDSDLDFLFLLSPKRKISLFDLVHMEKKLSELVNRPVDLISKKGIEQSRNYIRRRNILESARVIYVA